MKSNPVLRYSAAVSLVTCLGISAALGQDRDDRQRGSQSQSHEFQLASQIMDARIQDENGQNLGTVRNMAVDLENGLVGYVIVDKNEGDKLIPVPFRALTFNRSGQTARVNVNESRFNDAPDFEPSNWGIIGDKKWGRIVFQHYALEDEFDRMMRNREWTLVQARQVMNAQAVARQREQIGRVEDFVIHTRSGAIPFVLVSMNENKNENRLVAVPSQLTTYQSNQQTLAIRAERNKLANAPTVNRNAESFDDRSVNRIYSHFDVEPGDFYGYTPPNEHRDSDRDQGRGNNNSNAQSPTRYNQLFEPQNIQRLQGRVTGVEQVTPFKGMEPIVQLNVRDDNNRNHRVHLGPHWFIERQQNQFQDGDRVQVVGSQANLEGQQIIMANYVQQDDRVLLLRSERGMPVWDAWRDSNELRRQDDRYPTPNQGSIWDRDGNQDRDND